MIDTKRTEARGVFEGAGTPFQSDLAPGSGECIPCSVAPGSPEQVTFSVIITCYFEEKSIDEFYSRLSATLRALGRSYEIIFVNDGSTDGTLARLRAIQAADPQVSVVIDLFKNSGQRAAVTAGIAEAIGRNLVFIDSDLQLDPEELPLLVEEFDKGADIVSGFRKERHDPPMRLFYSKIANAIMRRVSKSRVSDFGCTYKIYNGALVRAFNYSPLRLFNQVDVIAQAQRIREVAVTHHERRYGKSGWTFGKLLQFNMDNLVRLSETPFQILGVVCLGISLLLLLRIALEFVHPFTILGRVTNEMILYGLIISLLVTLSALSVIGEFAIRSFLALQRSPLYIVRHVWRRRDTRGLS